MKRFVITEEEKHDILRMYNLLSEDVRRPLQKLLECKITTDGKYIIFEGKAFSTSNGEQVPINEEWTISDILHTGADLLSVGLDFVIPGSGAIVDILNAISYVIEAQFKSNEEKDSLYLMAAITFAFVILPGPLQAIATPLKQAVKTGVGMADPVVKQGLKIIGNSIDTLLVGIPSRVNTALKSDLAVNILGKWGDKISGFISNFTSRIKQLLGTLTGKAGKEGAEVAGKKTTKEIGSSNITAVDNNTFKKMFSTDRTLGKYGMIETSQGLTKALNNVSFDPSKVKVLSKTTHRRGQQAIQVLGPNNTSLVFYQSRNGWIPISGYKGNDAIPMTISSKYIDDFAKFLQKNGVEGLTKTVGKKSAKIAAKASLTQTTKASLGVFLKSTPKIAKGASVLRKMGFVVGKPYRYVGKSGKATTATIKEITDNGVKVAYKNGTTTMVPVETFVKNAVGAPWMRRGYSVLVPLFVKRFADVILPDGTIDYEKLETLPDLNPDETSQESLEYLQEEVAGYQGDTAKYVSNTNVFNFQKALKMLGFNLGSFGPNKDGVDGKFGPQTQKALKDFQTQNALDSSLGRMDRATAKKLSEVLKTKNISGSEEVQTFLSSL